MRLFIYISSLRRKIDFTWADTLVYSRARTDRDNSAIDRISCCSRRQTDFAGQSSDFEQQTVQFRPAPPASTSIMKKPQETHSAAFKTQQQAVVTECYRRATEWRLMVTMTMLSIMEKMRCAATHEMRETCWASGCLGMYVEIEPTK